MTLHCECFADGKWSWFEPNGAPVRVASEWFEGMALLVIKTAEPNNNNNNNACQARVLGSSKRLLELQIQGRIRKRPTGVLYLGGELSSEKMQVSALTRLAARGALGFLRSSGGQGLHYSFGDGVEPPHIATPLWSSMPWIRVGAFELGTSSAGIEAAASKKTRRAGETRELEALALEGRDPTTWVLEAGSMVVAGDWKVKLPGLPSLDLHRLWGSASLVVGAYFLDGVTAFDDTPHDARRKTFLFKFRLTHGAKLVEEDELFFDASVEPDSDESFATARQEDDEEDVVAPLPKSVGDAVAEAAGRGLRIEDGAARCLGRLAGAKSLFIVTVGAEALLARRAPLPSAKAVARWTGDVGGISRLAKSERRRRLLDAAVSALAMTGGLDAVRAWLPRNAAPVASRLTSDAAVLRAATTRVWYEERWALTESGLSFFVGQKQTFYVDLADVVEARRVDPRRRGRRRRSPFEATLASLEVVCVERVLRLVVRDGPTRDAWVAKVAKAKKARPEPLPSSISETRVREALAAPGTDWLPKGRCVLNARRLFDDDDDDGIVEAVVEDAPLLAERLVRLCGEIDDDQRLDDCWSEFLDLAGRLRDVSPQQPLAFWLNVYHAMLAHAARLFGSPTTASQWARYFGTMSYECAGDVFSVAELEHNIVRSNMSNPRLQFRDLKDLTLDFDLLRVASATTIASPYASALRVNDVRLVFALNPGSISDSPPVVAVYDHRRRLDAQLDAASKRALSNVKLEDDGRKLLVPRLCAWHALSVADVKPYLPDSIRTRLAPACRLAYAKFDFACRIPRVLSLAEEQTDDDDDNAAAV